MSTKATSKHFRRGLFTLLSGAVASFAVAACSSGDNPEPVAVVEKAAEDPDATAAITLSFPLGEATDLSSVVVAARDYARLADRVELAATTSVAQGNLEVGNQAKVGALRADQTVRIGHGAAVSGDVNAGGAVIKEPSAQVSGSVNENLGSTPPVNVSWTVQAPVNSLGAVSVDPDQQRDLQPGRYSNVSVKSRATLTLHSGVYVFENLQVESQAQLRIDDREGPVQIITEGQFTFRGRVTSARQSIPQTLFAVQGTQDVFIEAPFIGALIAPNATVRFQAARPEGHRAVVVGKSVWLEPDTKIRRLPFDWGSVAGPEFDPVPEDAPVHTMPEGDDDLTVDIPVDGDSTTTTTSYDTPQTFELPDEYTVEGGIIGNGTAIFRFNPGTGWVECTYRGQSSSARPETPDELIKGTLLKFESCSDGLPHDAPRSGTDFEFTVNPIPDYPVTVSPPMEKRPNLCADKMEILTPAETRAMRQSFDWSTATKVAADNPDGTPTLYYAWVHIRNKQEALALKRLFIHVLNRPLFDEELLEYAGKCGTFTNPGDGEGMFVPVVIPGRTYNRLIDALTSDDVTGDRVIFDAVIIRDDVPAGARNANGSINLQVLGQSGFRYLDYEVNPFAPDEEIVLDGGASKVLTDVFAWVAQAARDAGEIVTGALNEIDQLFRGEVEVELWVHAITQDPLFKGQVMKRGWGSYAGSPIGATGMQVKLLQRMFNTFIPSTAKGDTNINGRVTIDATDGAETRGTGLCVELRTRAAIVTDFLIANEICDLRGYAADSDDDTGTVEDYRLDTLTSDRTLRLHIDNTRLLGLYQSDDVFRYSEHVMSYTPKRARILSGYWATTFAPGDSGDKRLFAPCLNFPNSLSDTIAAVAGGAGAGVGALAGSVIPGIGTAAGAAVGAIALGTFGAVVGNSDIVMSTQSKLRDSRSVMSHEYGHYMFCNMIYDADPDAVDHVVWATTIRGDVIENFPVRYFNEAIADYFMGQVSSGADYGWLNTAEELPGSHAQYCSDRRTPCFEENFDSNASDTQSIARVATLLLDVFDGHGAARTANVPTNADAWRWDASTSQLVWNPAPAGDAHDDTALERVALPGGSIRTIAAQLAFGMEPFVQYSFNDGEWEGAGYTIDEMKIRTAVDDAMIERNVSWCDRCRVLALHEEGADKTNVQTLWGSCLADNELQVVLGPGPDPDNLRLDADTCQVCPDGFTSDDNGQCVFCADTVVGNECNTCTSDVVLDGNTMSLTSYSYDVSQSGSGDNCPDVFLVEVQNADALFTRGVDSFGAGLRAAPENQATCERNYTLTTTFLDGSGNAVNDVRSANGNWLGCPTDPDLICIDPCVDIPGRGVTSAEAAGGTVFFRTPGLPNARLDVHAVIFPDPPR